MRFPLPTALAHDLYTPVLCLVLQGAKQVMLDGQVHAIGSGQGLVVNIEVPVLSRIVEASRDRPYLALALDLDLALLDELADELASYQQQPPSLTLPSVNTAIARSACDEAIQARRTECAALDRHAAKRRLAMTDQDVRLVSPPSPVPRQAGPVLALGPTQQRLLDCMRRLVDLTGQREAEAILKPGIVRELHYLLLSGPFGSHLRSVARPESHLRRIARATSILRQRFDEPLAIQLLADAAGMSASSFHQHFKAVTSYSPRQFQKQLRLMEARRLMQSEGATARHAAFTVGYESAQQFTREYARQFGAPPRRSVRPQAGRST